MADKIKKVIYHKDYTVPEAVTIPATDSSTMSYSDLGLPSRAIVVGGYIDTYNDPNAQCLLIGHGVWYSARTVNLMNISNQNVTISAGRVMHIYYIIPT